MAKKKSSKKTTKKKTPTKVKKVNSVRFYHTKAPNYMVHPVSGAFGGLTPKGDPNILVDFYQDRAPNPTMVEHEIDDNGKIVAELGREQLNGVERHFACGIIIDVQTAVTIRDWLSKKIDEARQIESNQKEVKK